MTLIRQLCRLGLGASLLLAGCFGNGTLDLTGPDPVKVAPPADEVVIDGTPLPPDDGDLTLPPADNRLQGAGGSDLTGFWGALDVPLSANAKMLAFDMMKGEVERATALSWVVAGADQWERNRAAFGGPNFQTTFIVDITPSSQKILLWRKMAYQVCLDAVTRDAGKLSRTLFTEVDPG